MHRHHQTNIYSISGPRPAQLQRKNMGIARATQRVIGSILYYAQAVDITVLMALSSIAIEQSKGTRNAMEKAKQLLDYLAKYPDAIIRFPASDMIMNVHSDASYLSESDARSRVCGHFFMGWTPKDGDPIKLNGTFSLFVPSFDLSSCQQRKQN